MSNYMDALLASANATIHVRGKLLSIELHAEGQVFTGEAYQGESDGNAYSGERRLMLAAGRVIAKYQAWIAEQRRLADEAERVRIEAARCHECGSEVTS